MVVRCKYKIQSKVRDARCYYCDKRCCGTLIFPDGSECWICEKHAFLKGKIKKFKKYLSLNEQRAIKSNFKNICEGKNRQGDIIRGEG